MATISGSSTNMLTLLISSARAGATPSANCSHLTM